MLMVVLWGSIASPIFLMGQGTKRSSISHPEILVSKCSTLDSARLDVRFAGINGSRKLRVRWCCRAQRFCSTRLQLDQSLKILAMTPPVTGSAP